MKQWLFASMLAASVACAAPLQAKDKDNNPPGPRGGKGTNWENPRGPKGGPGASPNRKHHYRGPVRHGPVVVVPSHRVRHYRHIRVARPHGHFYVGYGHHHHDADAFKWLAFTAITLAVLDNLNESQQRAHEQAQIDATNAKVGETITWNEGGASGAVTTTREGTTSSGRYCREFQQTVTIEGKDEHAYGTACQQPDGAWEVVSTGN